MSQHPLTEKRVAALLVPHDKRTWYSDASSPLKLLVGTSGTGTYYVRQRVRGDQNVTPVKLGVAGDTGLTLAEARTRATEEVARMSRGINPNDELREKRQTASTEQPLNEIAAEHIVWASDLVKGKPRNRSWSAKQATWVRYWQASLGRRPLSKLTQADVQTRYNEIARTAPVAANRAVELLSAVLNWKYGKGQFVNPTHGIRREREGTGRTRVLVAHEFERLEAALAKQTQNVQDIIHLLLLTGARKGNVLGMRWADLDLERGTWVIPGEQFKTGVDHEPALVDEAVAILRRRHEERRSEEWVFPSPRHGAGPISNIGREWREVRKEANIEDVKLHDLRHTCATYLFRQTGSLKLVRQQLGHAPGSRMTDRYVNTNAGDVKQHLTAATDSMKTRVG